MKRGSIYWSSATASIVVGDSPCYWRGFFNPGLMLKSSASLLSAPFTIEICARITGRLDSDVLAYVPGLRDFGIDTLKSEAPVNTCLRFA
jgi:hypothetical protein